MLQSDVLDTISFTLTDPMLQDVPKPHFPHRPHLRLAWPRYGDAVIIGNGNGTDRADGKP